MVGEALCQTGQTVMLLRKRTANRRKVLESVIAHIAELEKYSLSNATSADSKHAPLQEQILSLQTQDCGVSQVDQHWVNQIDARSSVCQQNVAAEQNQIHELRLGVRKFAVDTAVVSDFLAIHQSRLSALEMASYDGVFVWRVDDLEKLMSDAMNGVKVRHW